MQTLISESVHFGGYSFYIIYGEYKNGYYIAIPNWGVSVKAADPEEVFYNRESLTNCYSSTVGKFANEISVFIRNKLCSDTKKINQGTDSDNKTYKEKLDMPIEDLDLSIRSYNCLKSVHIDIVSDLIAKNETELIYIRNFGSRCLQEVKDKLNALGLKLAE